MTYIGDHCPECNSAVTAHISEGRVRSLRTSCGCGSYTTKRALRAHQWYKEAKNDDLNDSAGSVTLKNPLSKSNSYD